MTQNFTDYGEFYLPQSDAIDYDRLQSRHYTQIDHYLYVIDSDSLFRFDLKNNSYDSTWNGVTFPANDGGNYYEGACLASTNSLIFVYDGETVNALNISSLSWLSNISSPMYDRSKFSCIVHPIRKRLYVIGGIRTSIESMYVGDDQEISTQSWQMMQGSLSDIEYTTFTRGKRAVIYGDDIWLFGGYSDRSGTSVYYRFQNEITVINTITEEVSSGGSMGYGAFGTAPIVVNDFMYIFGGCTSWSASTDIFTQSNGVRFTDLLATRAPTNAPTTAIPTAVTGAPTDVPTASPITSSPSGSPTTAAPTTGAPTDSPTTAIPTAATDPPTTSIPTTVTNAPTTDTPTTFAPTGSPTTFTPTTGAPSGSPTTAIPTTGAPTTTMEPTSIVSTVYSNSESYEPNGSRYNKKVNMGSIAILLWIGAVFIF